MHCIKQSATGWVCFASSEWPATDGKTHWMWTSHATLHSHLCPCHCGHVNTCKLAWSLLISKHCVNKKPTVQLSIITTAPSLSLNHYRSFQADVIIVWINFTFFELVTLTFIPLLVSLILLAYLLTFSVRMPRSIKYVQHKSNVKLPSILEWLFTSPKYESQWLCWPLWPFPFSPNITLFVASKWAFPPWSSLCSKTI